MQAQTREAEGRGAMDGREMDFTAWSVSMGNGHTGLVARTSWG